MNQTIKYLSSAVIFIHFLGCAQDPLLNVVGVNDDNYSYRNVTIANKSAHAVGVCEFQNCDYEVPAGQTVTVSVRYLDYKKNETRDYVHISIQTSAVRKIAPLKAILWSPFLTEGSKIRWLGNFSGPHTFTVTAELAALAAERMNVDENYNRDVSADPKFAKALNLLDENMTLSSQIFERVIEITLPESDTEIYWGEGSTTAPDGASIDGSIVVGGWRYRKVPNKGNKTMYTDYTESVNFSCTDGGCFPD